MFDFNGTSSVYKASEMPLSAAPSISPIVDMRAKNKSGRFDAAELPSIALGRVVRRNRTRTCRATKVPQIQTALDETPASAGPALRES